MLHPLKVSQTLSKRHAGTALANNIQSTSSYECDGCNHHASFHSMENKSEDEVRKRWEKEARDKADLEEEAQQRSKKRPRLLQIGASLRHVPDNDALVEPAGFTTGSDATATTCRAAAKRPRRAAATKAKGRATELIDNEDDDIIEVD